MVTILPCTLEGKKKMISFHEGQSFGPASNYSRGFRAADVVDLERIAKCLERFVWSPIVWRDGVRRQDNFLFADYCVLDFDTPEMSLRQALHSFCDMRHIIGVTKSHHKDKNGEVCDRFRVVIPFEERITDLRHYRYVMYKILSRHPVDKVCKDGARFFYPCTDIISLDKEGYNEEVPPVPDYFERASEKQIEACRIGHSSGERVRSFFKRNYRANNRNNTIYGVSKDLAALGYEGEQIFQIVKKFMDEVHHSLHLSDSEIKAVVKNGSSKIATCAEAPARASARQVPYKYPSQGEPVYE